MQWDNTELPKGDLADEIKKLKDQGGKDIIVYGGNSFVTALIREGLIDEFHLFVNPVALGHGEPIFGGLGKLSGVHPISADYDRHEGGKRPGEMVFFIHDGIMRCCK